MLFRWFNEVIAHDPSAGTERWRRQETIWLDCRPGNLSVCRGVAYWRDADARAGGAVPVLSHGKRGDA